MDCGSCAAKIEHVVRRQPGVVDAQVNFATARLHLELDGDGNAQSVTQAVRALGYTVSVQGDTPTAAAPLERPQFWRDRRLLAVVVGAVAAVVGLLTGQIPAYVTAIVLGGVYVFRNAASSVRHGHLDINVLMTIAVIGAVLIGEWLEASTVVVMFAFAEWLEGASMHRARSAIRELMELAPPIARVRRGGDLVEIAPHDVAIGEVIVVRAGEKFALDGVISAGETTVNQAALTGESRPIDRFEGDEVFAGTLNEGGAVDVRVETTAGDTAIAHVARAIEQAQSNRSQTERFIERFARWYTPAVMLAAAALAIVGPLATGGEWGVWFYRALVMLVIACPCALVIATPITTVSGLARAARDGLLVKGGRYLEALGRVRAIVFDKTGTLTTGRPRVIEVVAAADVSEEQVVLAAAMAEVHSEHPLASAIVSNASDRGLTIPAGRLIKSQTHRGRGLSVILGEALDHQHHGHHHHHDHHDHGHHDHGHDDHEHHDHEHHDHGHHCRDHDHASRDHEHEGHDHDGAAATMTIVVGQRALLLEQGTAVDALTKQWDEHEAAGHTTVGVARDHEFLGIIACRDEVRPESAEAVRSLATMGVRAHICSGDSAVAVAEVATEVGIAATDVAANLFPEQKVAQLETIMAQSPGTVAMVGDGINDAPALATADVGVAMGAAGTDLALETAHVALMDDRLELVPHAVHLGRVTGRIIRQNVVLALGIKAVVFGMAVAGVATLWMAIAADLGTSLLVIGNGLRVLRA